MKPKTDVRAIMADVGRRRGIDVDDLVSSSRTVADVPQHELTTARRILWLRLRQAGLSYPQIGKLVGRDHTTVMAGVRQAPAVCCVCGCTDDDACDGGCTWVTGDLCSACEKKDGEG